MSVPRRSVPRGAGPKGWAAALVVMLLLVWGGDFRLRVVECPVAAQDGELAEGWTLRSGNGLDVDGSVVSSAGYDDAGWVPVRRMPGTVLGILQDAGVYPNLYFGKNLLTEVPQDLYRQDWWYRTTFTAPDGLTTYRLDFPGINYRADIWLNGHLIADARRIVGMYNHHDLDVTPWIAPGSANTLAVRVIPERAMQDVDGVELADSWYDWINWRYLGYQGAGKNPANGNSFVADRNAGIFKPVHLRAFGPVDVGTATVVTDLPLPDTSTARLTVYSTVRNDTDRPVRGVLRAAITRPGKPSLQVAQPVLLAAREQREIRFSPADFSALTMKEPDLWWPYTLGTPALYDLRLDFVQGSEVTSTVSQRFGIRTVTQSRTGRGPDGGDFYLRVNGRDFPIRGATYAPDLLYRYDPARDEAILRYVKDLGLNMLRLESKIASERFVEMADEMGIPLMYGWMCCNQWEKWQQWDAEDRRVAQESMRSQIAMLGPHPSVFLWANGSDGRPPDEVRGWYRGILEELHWQNGVVDTVGAFLRDSDGRLLWDGIKMAGPYSWRPPTYWFSGRYPASRGSSAEQGDNEHIPPYASLRRFIPPDKLWPINDTWYFHAGSGPQNSTLANVQRVIDRRYGPSTDARMFADKAQLAHYEATRAQFEAFAAHDFATHPMTIYWLLNSHWPSFFANIFDYYLRPGGAYYGAKQGLRPLSVVFDSYATGDGSRARVSVVNQTPDVREDLRARVRIYDLDGRLRDVYWADGIGVAPGAAVQALTIPPGPADSPVFFVRCELLAPDGAVLTENIYWQSRDRDDVGPPANDSAFDSFQTDWADMTALNTMPEAALTVTATASPTEPGAIVVRLRNTTDRIAFFQRVELLTAANGDEILPVTYDDNYVTVFPGEQVDVHGRVASDGPPPGWVRVSGYNSQPVVTTVR